MKTFLLALSLLFLPSFAFGQTTPNAGQLMSYINTQLAGIANPCPTVIGATMGDPADSATWTIEYASAPNGACTAAVAGFIASFATLPTTMQIVSATYPALNGTYPIDTATQQYVQAISLYVAINGQFPAGLSSMPLDDIYGVNHKFPTTASWQAFATAMQDFVTSIAVTLPVTQPVQIP